jgi:hypothetical protein
MTRLDRSRGLRHPGALIDGSGARQPDRHDHRYRPIVRWTVPARRDGHCHVKGLPAGTYSVSFDLASFQKTTNDNVFLTVGGVAEVNSTMSAAGRAETVNVTAEAPSPIASVTLSKAYTKAEVDLLPVAGGRRTSRSWRRASPTTRRTHP